MASLVKDIKFSSFPTELTGAFQADPEIHFNFISKTCPRRGHPSSPGLNRTGYLFAIEKAIIRFQWAIICQSNDTYGSQKKLSYLCSTPAFVPYPLWLCYQNLTLLKTNQPKLNFNHTRQKPNFDT